MYVYKLYSNLTPKWSQCSVPFYTNYIHTYIHMYVQSKLVILCIPALSSVKFVKIGAVIMCIIKETLGNLGQYDSISHKQLHMYICMYVPSGLKTSKIPFLPASAQQDWIWDLKLFSCCALLRSYFVCALCNLTSYSSLLSMKGASTCCAAVVYTYIHKYTCLYVVDRAFVWIRSDLCMY